MLKKNAERTQKFAQDSNAVRCARSRISSLALRKRVVDMHFSQELPNRLAAEKLAVERTAERAEMLRQLTEANATLSHSTAHRRHSGSGRSCVR